MSKKYEYYSVFAAYMTDFLKMKAAQGVNLHNYNYFFEEFDRFFIENNVHDLHITESMIAAWSATRVNDHRRTLYAKQSCLTQFCRYLCHLGIGCYIPRLPKRPPTDYTPYVFSHDEISRIFAAIDNTELKMRHMTSFLITAPTLFRFLYSTGVRIGEALSIKNEDVDLEKNVVTLKKTKNKMHRIVPINSSLKSVLEDYISYRDKMPVTDIRKADKLFFVNCMGGLITSAGVLARFQEILKACKIPYMGKNKGPRVHDLRHTFAVHSLHQMVSNGMDIYCALPILSVFLGHKNIYDTEWYVRMTQEIYPDLVRAQEDIASFVFPLSSL
jgi:integrase